MNILFDHQTFTDQEYGGISRYFYEVLKSFQKTKLRFDLSLIFSNNAYIQSKDISNHHGFFANKKFPGKRMLMRQINQYETNQRLRKGYDLFHPTYYDPYFLSSIKIPYVITVYDMMHELGLARELRRNDKFLCNKKRVIENAERIIAISHHTKADLIDILDVPESKIDVVHLASSLSDSYLLKNSMTQKIDYVLYVGNREGYKNFDFLLNVLQRFLITNKDLTLICAGGGSFQSGEIEKFAHLGISRQVLQVPIDSDQQLFGLYANALAFVFPSLYEGFGIPILEAFEASCPAILSNSSSLPEVGGAAAEYFDPKNPESLYKILNKVLNSNDLRENLKESGLMRKSKFSWDLTAQKSLRVYSEVLK